MFDLVTLISHPNHHALGPELIKNLTESLSAFPIADTKWLAPECAIDLHLTPSYNTDLIIKENILAQLRNIIGERPIDIAIHQTASRKKQLFMADMDSTIIQQECIDELADMAGFGEKVASITEAAMQGQLDFSEALRTRVALLKDLPTTTIDEVLKKRIQLTPGAETLLATLKANHIYTSLVSGGFTHFTQAIKDQIGFDETRANTLIEADGKFTGQVADPILGREAKLQRLNELSTHKGIARAQTCAIGDGANDISMIKASGTGIAFHAKPALKAEADIEINHTDLTSVLYLFGFKQNEFIEIG